MTFPKKAASMLVVAVLSVAGLAAVTMAVGHDGRFGQSAWAEPGKNMGKGRHGGKSMCHRGGKHGKYGKHGRRGPDFLAKKLAVMETEIGIRANQLDAWRDFTDALQATMTRPMGPGGPGMKGPGYDAEPFALAERFADKAIARAENAEKLKAAIATLRTTLTPEQLEKVKKIEDRVRARMSAHHGWGKGPGGMGHGGMGGKDPGGKGPGGKGPDGGPSRGDNTPGNDGNAAE